MADVFVVENGGFNSFWSRLLCVLEKKSSGFKSIAGLLLICVVIFCVGGFVITKSSFNQSDISLPFLDDDAEFFDGPNWWNNCFDGCCCCCGWIDRPCNIASISNEWSKDGFGGCFNIGGRRWSEFENNGIFPFRLSDSYFGKDGIGTFGCCAWDEGLLSKKNPSVGFVVVFFCWVLTFSFTLDLVGCSYCLSNASKSLISFGLDGVWF